MSGIESIPSNKLKEHLATWPKPARVHPIRDAFTPEPARMFIVTPMETKYLSERNTSKTNLGIEERKSNDYSLLGNDVKLYVHVSRALTFFDSRRLFRAHLCPLFMGILSI